MSFLKCGHRTVPRRAILTCPRHPRFKQAWAEVDPKGTGYISKTQIAALFSVSNLLYEWTEVDHQLTLNVLALAWSI